MLRARFGEEGVDEAARAPFKAGQLRQPRKNLDMPVIVVGCWHVKWLGVKKVIVCRLSDCTLDTTDNVTHDPRPFAKLARLRIFIAGGMSAGGNPDFVRHAAGVGAEGDEI